MQILPRLTDCPTTLPGSPSTLPGSPSTLPGSPSTLPGSPSTLPRRRAGFTLIEILIVISIIGLVASLILVAIQQGRKKAMVAATRVEVSSLSQALEQYVQDESVYPGMELEPDVERNDFPRLYNAIFGKKKPGGPGGRSSPYTKHDESKVTVLDEDTGEHRQAVMEEIRDPKTDKYLTDPLGNVYVYRANKGKSAQNWMHNTESADVYSLGLNGVDDTAQENEQNDDIGNW